MLHSKIRTYFKRQISNLRYNLNQLNFFRNSLIKVEEELLITWGQGKKLKDLSKRKIFKITKINQKIVLQFL